MPWTLLAFSTFALAAAVNVWRPHHGRAAVLSFFAGWLAGELSLHVVSLQLVLTWLFVTAGALGAWPGLAALAVCAVAWTLLLASYLGGRHTSRIFDRALRDGLGERFDETLPPAAHELDWRAIIAPFPIRRRDIEVIRNVDFHDYERFRLRLDVYRRKLPADAQRPTRCPTFVYVHGGAWVLGYRERQGLPLLQYLASLGWVCFSVDYRLSPLATFPDHLVDVKRALAWVRANGQRYGADTDFIAIGGNSAGGHLASLAALTQNDPDYQPGFEPADTHVDACVSFYGVYDFADRHQSYRNRGMRSLLERHVMKSRLDEARAAWDLASPIARVRDDAPPFLVVHGDRDTLVPVAQADHFVAALRARAHAPVVYARLPGAQHAFDVFPSLRTDLTVRAVARFLIWAHAQSRPARTTDTGESTAALGDV